MIRRRQKHHLYWLRLILPLCRFIVICENDVCKAGIKTILEPLSVGTQVAESECLQMKKHTAFSSCVNLQSSQSMLTHQKS